MGIAVCKKKKRKEKKI